MNRYAVSAEDVGEALTKCASTMSIAGNTIQETSAMATGITEVTQDPAKAGNALKIVSLRLRGMKGKLEALGEDVDGNIESLSKMQTHILNLTSGKVNIFNDDGSFKSTYEIMDSIAEIYDKLTDTKKADLLETIAGKNRSNDIAALLNNWSQVEKAVKSATDAEGSASIENEKYMESMQGRLDTLTASWQALSNTTLDSDFLKSAITGITEFVDVLDLVIDKVGVLTPLLGGAGIFAFIKDFKSFSNIGSSLSSIISQADGMSGLVENFKKLYSISSSMGGNFFNNFNSVKNLFDTFGSFGELESGISSIKELSTLMKSFDGTENAISGVVDAISGLSDSSKIAALGMFDLSESQAQAILTAAGFSAEEAATAATTIATSAAVEGASFSFATFGAAVKGAAASLATFLLTNPVGWAIIATTAIVGVTKAYDALTVSFDEAKEKAINSKGEYDSAASEVEQLQSQLQSIQDKKSEINSSGKLSITDQKDLANLNSQEARLQNILSLKQNIAQYEQRKAANDAQEAFNKSEDTYVSGYDKNNYPIYSQGNIIQKTSDLQDQLNAKTEEYYKLIDKNKKISDKKDFDINGMSQDSKDYRNNEKYIEEYRKEIEDLNSEISNNITNDILPLYNMMFDDQGNVISGYEDTVALVDALINKVNQSSGNVSNAQSDVVSSTDNATGSIDSNTGAIQSNTDAVQENVDILETAKDTISEISDYQDKMSSAINDATSATGLSSEEIENLIDMYGDLDGFDISTLFERTANGVHINEEALRTLNAQYEAQQGLSIKEQLQSLGDEYNDLTDKIIRCADEDKKQSLISERDEIGDKIKQLQLLQSEYEGLTSKYNKWVQARSTGSEGDMYEDTISGLKELKELYKKGFVGDDDFRTGVDFMTYQDMSTATVDELTKAYDKARKRMSRYFTDGQKGCQNFLDDLKEMGAATEKDGVWNFDFDDEEVAKKLNLSVEAVQIILGRLKQYGFDIDIDPAIESIDTLESRVQESESKLKEMNQEPVNINIEAEGKDAEEELKKAKQEIDKIKNSDASVEVKTAKLDDAYAKVEMLVAKVNQPAFMNIDVSQVDSSLQDALSLLQQYQTATNHVEALKIEGADSSEIDEAQKKVSDLAGQIKNLPDDVKTKIGIDTSDLDTKSLKDQIQQIKPEVFVNANTSEAEGVITSFINNCIGSSPKVINVTANTSQAQAKIVELNQSTVTVTVHANTAEANNMISGLSKNKPLINGTVKWTNDKSEVDSYSSKEKTSNGIVKWSNYTTAVDNFKSKVHTATGTVKWGNNTTNVKTSFSATGTVKWKNGNSVDGTAHVNGTAFEKGNWGTKDSGIALGGELGQELLVRNGHFYTIGDDSAEFFKYRKNDIVYSVLI